MSQYLLNYKQINFLRILVSNSIYNEIPNLSVQRPKPQFRHTDTHRQYLWKVDIQVSMNFLQLITISLPKVFIVHIFPINLKQTGIKQVSSHFSNTMLLSNIPTALSRSESSSFPFFHFHTKHRRESNLWLYVLVNLELSLEWKSF